MLFRRSIAGKIGTYAVLLVFVISAGLGFLAYYSGSASVVEEVERALQMQAVEASKYVESVFETQLAVLSTIAARPDMKWMDWGGQRLVLRSEIERLPYFELFGVVEPSGKTRLNDGTLTDLGIHDFSDKAFVQRAFEGEQNVSDVLVDPETGRSLIMFAVPIINNDAVVGVLFGQSDASLLSDVTDELGFGESGWAFIIDSDGMLIAYPDREVLTQQINVFTAVDDFQRVGEAIKEFGLGQNGVIQYRLTDGQRLVGLAPIPSTGWTIAVGALESEVLSSVRSLRSFIFLIAVAFLVLGALVFVFLGRRIAEPLQHVREAVEALADGDLTKVVEVKSRDEVGVVAQAVGKTIDSLRYDISTVVDTARELAGTSEQMAAATEEISASIEEVASTTNQFSSALDTMNLNAQTMSESVQEVSNRASMGEKAIADIVTKISELRDNTQLLADGVSQLGSLSGQIGDIVNVITDIAEQTNLLALNAAIEAARAGEHGRGFAVVAEEVRTLAEQSSKATADITNLINQIQGGISSTVSGMKQGADQAEEALTNVNNSGELLHGILGSVTDIADQVESISSGLQQLNVGGQEIASATEEQAASIAEVATSSQNLTDLGVRLRELVERFKL